MSDASEYHKYYDELFGAMDFSAIKCLAINFERILPQQKLGQQNKLYIPRQLVHDYISCMNKFYSENYCDVLCGARRLKGERDIINDHYRLGKAAMVKVNTELTFLTGMPETGAHGKMNFEHYLASFKSAIEHAREIRKIYTAAPKYGGGAAVFIIIVIAIILVLYFAKSHFAVRVQMPDNQTIAPFNTAKWMLDPSAFWERSGVNF